MGCLLLLVRAQAQQLSTEDIIADIYAAVTEITEVENEELHTQLMQLADHPLNINQATSQDLAQLYFLSQQQIDDIQLYRSKHPFISLSELLLIPSLKDYEVRDLIPFVYVGKPEKEKIYGREIFTHAKHILSARMDVRNIEDYETDPIYARVRYDMNYQNRIQAGVNIVRSTGVPLSAMSLGAYVQIRHFGPIQTAVVGNYQAQFGEGLVLANNMHMGKSTYVAHVGNEADGIKKYGGIYGESLHGVAATASICLNGGKTQGDRRLDISALYSMNVPNDSLQEHVVGGNMTLRYGKWRMGITAIGKLYTDSVRYYYEHAAYNQNYFRGDRQAVMGLNFRHCWGKVDIFGEIAAAQNKQWGYAAVAGMKIYPIQDVSLIAIYRFYSLYYDNTLGYSLCETSRINDENGGYVGIEVKRIKNLKISFIGDVYGFKGVKYGINYSPSFGFDVLGDINWRLNTSTKMFWRLRAREKGNSRTYSFRYQVDWIRQALRLRTFAEVNWVPSNDRQQFGASIYQDIAYSWSKKWTVQTRWQAFYVPNWNNRIYTYENDVLYGYSVPAIYGIGGRMYINIRWRTDKVALYLRASETIYEKKWANDKRHGLRTRTDIHVMVRFTM